MQALKITRSDFQDRYPGWFQMCRASGDPEHFRFISMLHFLKCMTFLLLKIRSQFCMSFYALRAALTPKVSPNALRVLA